MPTLRQYLFSLSDPYGLTRTLGEIEVCRNAAGYPIYSAGNTAVVFRVRHAGRQRALRCYFRPRENLETIYGGELLREELYIYDTPQSGTWVDVVLTDWIEGENFSEAIHAAATAHDRERLGALAATFDRLATTLLADSWAHGDLKPDNLILDHTDTLHLIDRDALFLPAFRGLRSPELGTRAFQHPARTAEEFNERLDDYPAALISTALHALRLDPTLYDRYGARDGLLFDPPRIARDPALQEALQRFAEAGEALSYRIAQGLQRVVGAQRDLLPLFEALIRSEHPMPHTLPTPFVELGRWGYGTVQGVIVPPVYDWASDFSEGLAAVLLGGYWHFIDPTGAVVLHCPPCKTATSFYNGLATIETEDRRYKMDKRGNLFDF